MTIREVTSEEQWEVFLAEARPPTFLQSWAWGETQAALGEEVVRLGAYDGETLVGIAQAVTVTARRGKFLHLPHGPVVESPKSQFPNPKTTFNELIHSLRDEATRRRCAFLRVSPILEDTEEHRAWFRDLGFRPAPIHLHAERLWILDCAPSEEELLAGMRKTTRNLIRRAEREGVTVRLSDSLDDLERFLELYEETAHREHFVPFSRRAIEAEVRELSSSRRTVNEGVLVGIAEHRGMALAGAVVPLTPRSAFYHHGASARTAENIPAAYALHWTLIREARRRGCRQYNFWGVIRTSEGRKFPNFGSPKSHPWFGLTLFKTGFGGREVPLVPTQDLALSPRYWIAYTVDTLRRVRRHL